RHLRRRDCRRPRLSALPKTTGDDMTDVTSGGNFYVAGRAGERSPAASRGGTRAIRLTPERLPPGLRLLGPVLVVLAWEAASRLGLLSPATLTAPSTALVTGYQMFSDGSL